MSKFRLICAVLFALFLASSIHAADIAVDADCSLADAIIAANRDRAEGNCSAGRGADIITLSQDITLDGGLPKITSDITIEGNGYTISGNNRYRIFYNDGGALTIHDLTMTKGYVEGELILEDRRPKNTTENPIGGAIVNWQGTVTVSSSTFSDNLAEEDGGAIYNWGGELSISDSAFSDNLADDDGGAIYNSNGTLSIVNSAFSDNSADENGGAIRNYGELSIVNSAFSDNSADENGGAIYNWGGELSIGSSAFSDNSAEYGGAIYNWSGELSIGGNNFSGNSAKYGGAIYNRAIGELSIVNSIFSLNSADNFGGAILNEEDGELSIVNSAFSYNSASNKNYNWSVSRGGAIDNGGELRIGSSTFSGNSADKGGAIFNGEDGKLRMTNSIIAGRGGACYSEGRLRHNISNFIQDGSCSPAFSGDPKLDMLIVLEAGLPVYYFPLLAGSRAIDAADDDYCPETDQIGTKRPQGTGCDIGAIEFVASSK